MKRCIRETGIIPMLILVVFFLSACGGSPADQSEAPSRSETPAVSVTAESDPPYDPLTDSAVRWGSGTDKCPVLGFMTEHIWFGTQLEELLQQAEDDTLIAFYISGMRGPYYPAIDPDRMEIPEKLDLDGVLTELTAEYARAETQEQRYELYVQINDFLTPAPYASTQELRSEEQRLWAELCAEITREWGLDPNTWTAEESAAVWQETDARLLKNERYQEIQREREAIRAWNDLADAFQRQFEVFYIEEMRLVMAERGFLPVYASLEEDPDPGSVQGYFFGTFIGTAAQIRNATDRLQDYEGYMFVLAHKP